MSAQNTDDQTAKGAYVEPGKDFKRDTNYIKTRITLDAEDGYPVEPGR
jgi:putative glutathione S-transferase